MKPSSSSITTEVSYAALKQWCTKQNETQPSAKKSRFPAVRNFALGKKKKSPEIYTLSIQPKCNQPRQVCSLVQHWITRETKLTTIGHCVMQSSISDIISATNFGISISLPIFSIETRLCSLLILFETCRYIQWGMALLAPLASELQSIPKPQTPKLTDWRNRRREEHGVHFLFIKILLQSVWRELISGLHQNVNKKVFSLPQNSLSFLRHGKINH